MSAGDTVTPGTYTLGDGIVPRQPDRQGVIRLITTDENCFGGPLLTAAQGAIVVSSASPSGIAGSFQATFADAGTFTGSFRRESA